MARLLNLKTGNADVNDILPVVTAVAADGAITIQMGAVIITKSSAAAVLTLAIPTTAQNGTRIEIVSATAQAHTITVTTAGFNDLGAAGDVATFGGAKGDGLTVVAYNGDWFILHRTNITLG